MILSDELVALQHSARRFVTAELLPAEAALPDVGPLPDAEYSLLSERLRQAGLWALGVPQEYGGQGASALAQVLVLEELSRSLLGLALAGRTGEPLPILYGANDEQKERYLLPVVRGERLGAFALTEPTGGSDPVGNMRTRAVRERQNWVLDGRKSFVSLGELADHVVVFAVTDASAGARGITAFIVDTDTTGFEIVRTIPTMGPMWPAELDLSNCRVSDRNRVGEIGQGFLLAQQLLGRARMDIGARAVGACDRLLELALSYVSNRISFGSTLSDHGGVQWMLADCAIDLDATRWMTYASAARVDAGQDTRIRDSMVKVFASEALGRVADRVLQLFGGWGYSKDLPIERFYREARMWRIVEGPNEVHRWAVARALNRQGVAAIRPV